MLDVAVLLEIGPAVIDLEDVCRFCNPQPELFLPVRPDGEIRRAQKSRRDLDVFLAFRSVTSSRDFSREKNLSKDDSPEMKLLSLKRIALKANRETVVLLDPEYENGLVYDDYLLIRFESHNPHR